ncbi:hypothetical protein CNMCM5793_002306 [Aspergillus hiratsukae]|uniref:Uncharacterized protein n=1 Tax=Aspergillus hiratsukae TaxID=1194566 RepID=A0A8H6UGJ1_9EURO|nr:hypothetical protein CNMCM5793_002306 [Aspergillus hiratsukae]
MANTSIYNENWFNQPQGSDYPPKLYKDSGKWRICRIASAGNGWLDAQVQVILESQQPRLVLRTTTKESGWHLVIPLQNCSLNAGIEGERPDDKREEQIRQFRQQWVPEFQDWHRMYYLNILCHTNPIVVRRERAMLLNEDPDWTNLVRFPWVARQAESVFILQKFDPKFKTVPDAIQWLRVLGGLATEGAFRWYRQNSPEDEEDRSPPMPWLFTDHDPSKRQYTQLIPLDPFFIDDHDRYSRLAEASKIEKDTQYRLIAKVFNPSRRHRAWYTPAQSETLQHSFFVHIKLQAEEGETEVNVPQLAELTEVQFEVAAEGRTYLKTELNQKGVVVETHRPGDLVLLVKGAIPQHGGEVEIVTLVKPNTMPIDEKIKALRNVSLCSSWGELEGKEKQGFSLQRTVLAHGVELDPASDFYFLLDARKISEVPLQQQDERIAYILENFPLDEAQHQAFLKSTFKVTCGVNLIQGPPGTGKTRTAMFIILLLMALDLKVLLVAGSNKGVDNLAEAVVAALNKYPQLRQWCGQFIRFRTPSYQLAQVRIDSANSNQAGLGVLRRGSSASQILEQAQIHNVVQRFANEYAESTSHCGDFLDMVRKDKECHLSKDQSKKLRDSYESCALSVLANCNVVATTLSNASHQLLRDSDFNPDFVISDEAGQCLEGEHCIALTMSSVKAVVLIGDPDQVPPTVISENYCNEGAKYLKRSLMARLHKAGYPCTILNTNYRNHSAILDFWNQNVYGGALQVGRSNDAPDRVGNAWDAFTSSRHYFRGYGVAGLCQQRLSSYNRPQVEVLRHLLSHLYQFETPQGDKIEPKDVMIISPYRDQRTLVDEVLGRHNIGFNENVTVEAAQGSEAPVVVFLMTKPSEDVLNVGFVGNKNRLNVALSRAQKVLIIIGNLRAWNSEAMKEIVKSSGNRNKLLLDLLRDVTQKRHTLTWYDARTVEELDPPPHVEMIYRAHDRVIPRPSMRVATPAVATTAGVQSPRAAISVPRPQISLPQRPSYRQALQPLPPRSPLPGPSAAPRQDEGEVTDKGTEMEDSQHQGTSYPELEPRRNVNFADQQYQERVQALRHQWYEARLRELSTRQQRFRTTEERLQLQRHLHLIEERPFSVEMERALAEQDRAAIQIRLLEEEFRQFRERRRHE